MKIQYKGIMITVILVIIGIAILLPAYFPKRTQSVVMLSFSITNNDNLPKWCNDLSNLLKKYEVKAAIFIAGKIAYDFPNCVSSYSSDNNIDIGSSTYNYSNVAFISDYSKALEEIEEGKKAVDNAAKINSSLFKAPYGSTDQNIYSLLSRSGIVADFSYPNHYNKYENGQFIRYDLKAFNGTNSTEVINNISSSKGRYPILINFNNTISINEIENFIGNLKSQTGDINFTKPSDLTNLVLTIRN